ncbi:hypothetical protein BS47DRAFT_1357197 [Hydnum rufescens UP504]|uniref:Uncharacterized protein n=1 Tax=Hydnum rufescens UP504 TaxID=1448309 RepID=A0A9P6BCG2_9AGAM|nr:hypothetical protein BS47DRAFT_1357197 [Hydnum rufescens UP504]
MESSTFTNTIVWVAQAGQPIIYKPDVGFQLTLLHCGQIVQDAAAEIAKHYFLSNPDPYKFDPGGVLAIHLKAGVPSQERVTQLAALTLHHLHTGLKVIAQLQSIDDNNLFRSHGYIGLVSQEVPTPGTLASGEGTQLPRPWFEMRNPQPSVDLLCLLAHTNQSMTPRALQPEFHNYQLEESNCIPAVLPMTSFLTWCDSWRAPLDSGCSDDGEPNDGGGEPPLPQKTREWGPLLRVAGWRTPQGGEAHLGKTLQLEWLNYRSRLMVPMPRLLHGVLKPAGFDPAGEIPTGWEYQCGPMPKTHQEPAIPWNMQIHSGTLGKKK